jgi:hypothetical protein
MSEYNTKSNKTDGFQMEPVRVELDGNREIEAVHHIVNDQSQLLHLYIEERAGGVDLSIPLSNVVVIAKNGAGAHAIEDMTSDVDTIAQADGFAADGGDL